MRACVGLLLACVLCATPLQAQDSDRARDATSDAMILRSPERFTTIDCGNAARARLDPLMQQRSDAWIAADKFRHFFASYGATAMGYGITQLFEMEHDTGVALAVTGAALAGLIKEIADVRGGSFFSFRDLVWDAAGIGAGVILANATRY